MTEPGERDLCIAPLLWFWFRERRSDGAPTLNCPFTKKVSDPALDSRTARSWRIRRFHRDQTRARCPDFMRSRASD